MTRTIKGLLLGAALAGLPAVAATAQPRTATATAPKLAIDMRYLTLPNGLKVVLSRDTLAPTVTVGVYYGRRSSS